MELEIKDGVSMSDVLKELEIVEVPDSDGGSEYDAMPKKRR